MFSNIVVIGLALIGLAAASGVFEVTVTEEESQGSRKIRHGVENYAECYTPLIQLYHQTNQIFLQTTSIEDSIDLCARYGYEYRGFLGRVMAKKEGCECGDGIELVAAYLLSKPGLYDYMIATDPADIAQLKQSGYMEKRLDFYCSPEPNKCGATMPLYRQARPAPLPFSIYGTTNENQMKTLKGEGYKTDVLCYVWPRQFNTNNYIGNN